VLLERGQIVPIASMPGFADCKENGIWPASIFGREELQFAIDVDKPHFISRKAATVSTF
jgi:hypothetical protein